MAPVGASQCDDCEPQPDTCRSRNASIQFSAHWRQSPTGPEAVDRHSRLQRGRDDSHPDRHGGQRGVAGGNEPRDQLSAAFPGVEFKIHHKPQNEGKGAALRDGFAGATGDLVIVQDADLEYDPDDYRKLLEPILDGKADVVYGSRFIGEPHRVLYFRHSVANKCLTALSNMFTNLNLTDMEVCYKVFRKSVLDRITLRCNRFGFEPEVTAKIAKLRPSLRIYEVGVAYHGRTYEEGKKITWKDGVKAVAAIIRFRFFD
jgi:glycosyltransferase involved in cell wall biosynthesis